MMQQKWRGGAALIMVVLCVSIRALAETPIEIIPLPTPTVDQIPSALAKFDHAPFAKSGCNLLSLPFRYSSTLKDYDRTEAEAFAFLMGFDLEWIPGNYCARHTYFVFERDAAAMKLPRDQYTPAIIATSFHRWSATAAIGGTLHRTEAGLGGTIEIYDPTGSITFTKTYPAEDFFKLLGDMDVDVMHQFGFDPPAKLASYFYELRCQHVDSLKAVGQAAFQPRGTMLEVFANVLKQDPTFGEVAAWRAHMNAWSLNQSDDAETQILATLSSRLTVEALNDSLPRRGQSADVKDLYEKSIDQAAAMAGEDSPVVVNARLTSVFVGKKVDADLIQRGLALAAKYPNDGLLLGALDQNLLDFGDVDAELGGVIAWTSAHSRYSPGIGDQRGAWLECSQALGELGRSDLATVALRQYHDDSIDYRIRLAENLFSEGQLQEVIDLYDASPVSHDANGEVLASHTLLAGTLLGNDGLVKKLRQEWASLFDLHGIGPCVDQYFDARQHKPLRKDWLQLLRKAPNTPLLSSSTCLTALADLALHRDDAERVFLSVMDREPAQRIDWIVLNAYIQQNGWPRGEGFYDALSWLYPDDPWVKKASASFAARPPAATDNHDSDDVVVQGQSDKLDELEAAELDGKLTSAKVDAALHSYLNPFDFAASIHRLLQKNRKDDARLLATRFHTQMLNQNSIPLRAWAQRLLHLTQG